MRAITFNSVYFYQISAIRVMNGLNDDDNWYIGAVYWCAMANV